MSNCEIIYHATLKTVKCITYKSTSFAKSKSVLKNKFLIQEYLYFKEDLPFCNLLRAKRRRTSFRAITYVIE